MTLLLWLEQVVVVESRDRVGGRVCDDTVDGSVIGRGAQLINGCVNNPFALICHQAIWCRLKICLWSFGFSNGLRPICQSISPSLPSGWAGCYTCPALRPYQFGPMRNPDVTKGHSDRLWSWKAPATWDWWRVVWLFLSCGLLLVSSSPSD